MKISDMVESTRETRTIARAATDGEIAAAGRELARLLRTEEEVAQEKAHEMTEYKDRLDGIRGAIRSAREVVEKAEVAEDVAVDVVYDSAAAKVTVTRADDGTLVDERAMTAEELEHRRQLRLAPAPPPENVETFPAAPDPES